MPIRESMETLVARTRVLVSDKVGVDQVFEDQDIQDALDERRKDVLLEQLAMVPTYTSGGSIQYLTGYADHPWWEADVVVQNSTYDTITGISTPVSIANAELEVGKWTFSGDMGTTVYVTGKCYDLYGAAADVLESWMAEVKLKFDFLELGATFKESQSTDMIEKVVKRYRAKSWWSSVQMIRTDSW